MKAQRSERGQVLVLILLSIVGLMGFAALAVDGGQVYAERRRSQSAADAAALAAASKFQDDGSADEIRAAGLSLASQNGFINGDRDGTTTVQVNNPPVSGPYAASSDANTYFQVIITSKVNPIFSQFVFSGDQYITTEAVVQAEKISQASSGNAIFALNKYPRHNKPGVDFNGDISVHVKYGNIFSNSNGIKNGGSGGISVTDGGQIYTHDDFDPGSNDCGPGKKINPCPVEGVDTQSVPEIPEPYCPDNAAAPYTLPPADGDPKKVTYYVWPTANSVPPVLQPGIHCFYDGISVQHAGLEGTNVLLVLKSGDIRITGNPDMQLTRASNMYDYMSGNQYGGLLIFVSKTNTTADTITLGGTVNSGINGTVYAPSSTCNLGGAVDGKDYHTALICNDFTFHGNPDVWITYIAEENYQFPPSLSVKQ